MLKYEQNDHTWVKSKALPWVLVVVIMMSLFSGVLYFNGTSQAYKSSVTGDLMTVVSRGEDNYSQLSITEAISREHRTSYFNDQSLTGGKLSAEYQSYPQMANVIASDSQNALQIIGFFSGHQVSEPTAITVGYVSVFFMLIAMAIVLAGILAMRIFEILNRRAHKVFLYLGLLTTGVALIRSVGGIYDLGFFSQIAAFVFLSLSLLIESDSGFKELRQDYPVKAAMIRVIPIIGISHTWWLLLPIVVVFHSYFLITDAYKLFSNSKRKFSLTMFVYVIGGMLTSIPIISYFIKNHISIDSKLQLGGPVSRIAPVPTLSLLSCVIFYLFVKFLYLRFKQKEYLKSNLTLAVLYYYAATFSFISTAIFYQYKNGSELTYYSFKLIWSCLWVTIPVAIAVAIDIAAIVATFIVTYFQSLLKIEVSKNFRSSTSSLAYLALVLIAVFEIGTYANISASRQPTFNPITLSSLNKSIEYAKDNNKEVLVISDCYPYANYSLNRYADALLGTTSGIRSSYLSDVLSEKPKDQVFQDALNTMKNGIVIFDATPSIDSSIPSNRINNLYSAQIFRNPLLEDNRGTAWLTGCDKQYINSLQS